MAGEIVGTQKRILNGQGNGFGLAKGVAAKMGERAAEVFKQSAADVRMEHSRWEKAVLDVQSHLQEQYSKALEVLNNDESGILSAHLALLEDPALIEAVSEMIEEEGCCAK